MVEETKKEEIKKEETKEIKEEVKKEQVRDVERKNLIYKELEEIIKSRTDHNLTKDDYARLEKEYGYNYQTIRAYTSRIKKKLGVGEPPRTKKETKQEVKEEAKQEVKEEVQEKPKEVKNGSTDIANDINKSTPKEPKKKRITKVEVKTEQKPIYKQWWFWVVIAGAGLASLYLFRNISRARTIQKRNQELALQRAREAQQAQQAQQVQQPKQMSDWEKLILSNLNK